MASNLSSVSKEHIKMSKESEDTVESRVTGRVPSLYSLSLRVAKKHGVLPYKFPPSSAPETPNHSHSDNTDDTLAAICNNFEDLHITAPGPSSEQ